MASTWVNRRPKEMEVIPMRHLLAPPQVDVSELKGISIVLLGVHLPISSNIPVVVKLTIHLYRLAMVEETSPAKALRTLQADVEI